MPNIHPMIVHFTIALFTAAVVFDVLGVVTKRKSFEAAGWWNLLLATFAALTSVISGLIAASTLPHTEEIHRLMEIHMTLGLIVLGLMLVLFVWRSLNRGSVPARLAGVFLLLGVIGVGIMWTGAYYGGEMVYGHGMGVSPMMRQMMSEHHHHHEGAEEGHHDEMTPGDTTMMNMQHPDTNNSSDETEEHHLEYQSRPDSGDER